MLQLLQGGGEARGTSEEPQLGRLGSSAALAVALRSHVRTRPGRSGVVVLWVVAAALVLAGLFAQDPVTAKPEEASTSGMLHALASLIGIPGIPLAAMLLRSKRDHPLLLRALAQATWISLALMAAYLGWALPRAGGFKPEVLAGWMNRLVVATYLAWHVAMATHLTRDPRIRQGDACGARAA